MGTVPRPPTGLNKVPKAPNTIEGYRAWIETETGRRVWSFVESRAVRLVNMGARRVSMQVLVEAVRFRLKIEVNNTFRPWLADRLVLEHPELLGVLERRARRKAGPYDGRV